jgi:hypothetical protein
MMNRSFRRAGLVIALLALSACAPTVWDRPGTTQAEFSVNNAQCRLMAEGANPDTNTGVIHTGSFKRDLAVNVAAGLAQGLVQGLAIRHTYDLCMKANGYVEHASGAVASSSPLQMSVLPATPMQMPPPERPCPVVQSDIVGPIVVCQR